MKLVFRAPDGTGLFFDQSDSTYVVVDQQDMDEIQTMLHKNLKSQHSKDRNQAKSLLAQLREHKWVSLFKSHKK